jgi:hypothetical protein
MLEEKLGERPKRIEDYINVSNVSKFSDEGQDIDESPDNMTLGIQRATHQTNRSGEISSLIFTTQQDQPQTQQWCSTDRV